MNFEQTLKKSHADLAKLDQQIENVLSTLILDKELEEVDLLQLIGPKPPCMGPPLPPRQSSSTSTTSKEKGFGLSSKKVKKTHIGEENVPPVGPHVDSSRSFAFPAPSTSRSSKNSSKLQQPLVPDVTSAFKQASTTFTCEEKETFLIPVLDKWIFGATFINSSSIAQKLPYLVLTLTNGQGNVSPKCSINVFVYNFKSLVMTVDKDFNFMESRDTLPIQETPSFSTSNEKSNITVIQPGSKVLITACFSHPAFITDNDVSIVISLCSEDSNFIWTKKISINSRLALACYNEFIFEKFQVEIFSALSSYKVCFQLENLPSNTSSTSLINFVENELGLSEIRNVPSRFDTTSSIFATKHPSFLWASLFQVDICTRNPNSLRCFIYTKTHEQLQHYSKLLFHWISEEKKYNPSTKLRMNNMLSKTTRIETVQQAMEKEIQSLVHFLYLDYKKMFNRDDEHQLVELMDVDEPAHEEEGDVEQGSDSMNELFSRQSKTRVAVKWLQTYIKNMNSIDRIFM